MRKFFTKKKIIIGIILIVIIGVIGFSVAKGRNDTSGTLTDTVKKQDLKQTVLATGQVTSSTDLSLSFKGSGVVAKINAKVGQQVKAGDIIANLDQKDQAASLTSARGSLAAAQANYNKVVEGAGGEDVQVSQAAVDAAQTTLDNAKKSLSDTIQQQQTAVANAHKAFLNSTITAVPQGSNSNSGIAPTISGTYNSTVTGTYFLSFYSTSSGKSYKLTGLETAIGDTDAGTVSPLGTRGLFIQFPATVYAGDLWQIDIPNTRAANYVSNLNAYNSAQQTQQTTVNAAQNSVASAQAALDQAMAALALKKAQARPADVAAARAQILSAEGQVQAAAASLENTVIRAPANGTVTTVDIKVGEQSTPGKQAVVVQDVDNLYVEANVSEANIAQVLTGQEVSFTFDALGPDRTFKGTVQTTDPASTVVSGVVNYKVTASVEKLPEIKPGMTANMTILTAEKANVLSVPQRAVLSRDGRKFVRVIDDPKKKTYHEVEVATGMDADGGLVEVTSGLSENQEIVTFINTK